MLKLQTSNTVIKSHNNSILFLLEKLQFRKSFRIPIIYITLRYLSTKYARISINGFSKFTYCIMLWKSKTYYKAIDSPTNRLLYFLNILTHWNEWDSNTLIHYLRWLHLFSQAYSITIAAFLQIDYLIDLADVKFFFSSTPPQVNSVLFKIT